MWFYMYLENSSFDRPGRSASNDSVSHRRWSASVLGLLALLGSVALPGCEDGNGRDWDRSGGFREGGSRADGWRGRNQRDRDGFWHGRHGRGAPDGASDAGDAGLDDAGLDDAGAGLTADAGVGGSASSTGADAGAAAALDPNIQALSDGQILQVADTLLDGSIDRMNASLSLLSDAAVLVFVEQTLAEDSAAQSTLGALTAAVDATPSDSAVADDTRTANEAVLQELGALDAGAIDARFMSAQLLAEERDLALLGQLIAAADAPVLRAQLVVLQALRQARLGRAQGIAAAL
jgi:hypothetical protein